MGNDGLVQARSGTTIPEGEWTMPSLHATIPAYLWVYNHCLLKTTVEAPVEGMCKGISRYADSTRDLTFSRYAMVVLGIMQ